MGLLQENSAGQVQDRSASKSVNNSVPLHPGKNAEVFGHNNVRLSQRKFRDKSVRMSPSRDVPKQQCSSVPELKCNSVPRQECRTVPRQKCQRVPKQQCQAAQPSYGGK